MKKYKPWLPTESFLLPPSPLDWLPEGHLVYFLLDVVNTINIDAIDKKIQERDQRGALPYSTKMMVALLLYGYCLGVFSSRKIERATYEDVGFRVLAGGQHPDHTRISEFRRKHLQELSGVFLQVLKLCQAAGMVKLGHVAFDGTKVQGNASKHKAMSYKRMIETDLRLSQEIDILLKQSESVDNEEDARHGVGVRGEELPEELRRRQTRLERIQEAKAKLEEEARQARAEELRQQAEKAEERARTHGDVTERKRASTVAAKKHAESKSMSDDDEPPPSKTAEGLPMHRTKAKPDGTPDDSAQCNFTDPESRIMPNAGGFLQGYNCQTAVDDAYQVIVGQAVTNQSPDNGNLVPMLNIVRHNCNRVPVKSSADAGYWASGVAKAVAELGTDPYISTARRKEELSKTAQPADEAVEPCDDRESMRRKLRTDQGRAVYARRKAIVEPVNGQIKEAQRFRRFLLRGMQKVAGEWSLICTCHNLLKLYRFGPPLAVLTPALR